MLKNIFIFITVSCFGCFLYGIIYIYWDVEENMCDMTYMYGYPQYMKINVDATNSKFSNYGLYYYYEGKPIERAKNIAFNGAPIIFIPGNAGSHKQVRSLASVALKKTLDNGWLKRLDYFSIDYNEELTGLHGGFLEVQQLYLRKCINAVLKLYKTAENKSKIILIGHSMGGVVAQTMLADKNIANVINTIIFISSPLSAPVVNLDRNINQFYQKIDKNLNKQRVLSIENAVQEDGKLQGENDPINNILLVSIGGGNRDLLIYESLTMSKYLNLHAMTSSIPDVWLSCDHLSSTWCLQLMKVINRFLFSILNTVAITQQSFIDSKSLRMEKAYQFFAGTHFEQNVVDFTYNNTREKYIWHEDNRQRLTQNYKYDYRTIHFKMIPVGDLKAAIFISINVESRDWLYGCLAVKPVKDSYYCVKAVKLSSYVYGLPISNNKYQKQYAAYLDFTTNSNSNWTHILIRVPTSNVQQMLTTLNVDIHEPKERIVTIETNDLFTLSATTAINTNQFGGIYYKLLFPKLTTSYQSLQINLHAQECTKKVFAFSAKSTIPWAQGFEKYYHFTQKTADFIISVPVNAPREHNTTAAPIILELFFNSHCKFTVSYQTPFGSIMARIIRTYYGNIPAYITAVLLFTLALQLRTSSSAEEYHKLPFNLLQTASTFLFLLLFLAMTVIPLSSVGLPKSVLLTFILYGTALVISTLIVSATYLLFVVQNFLANKLDLLAKFTKKLSLLLYIISIALFAISFYFSGGLALCIGLFFYFFNNAEICRKPNSAEKYDYIKRQIFLCALYFVLTLLNLPATIATLKSWQLNPASLKDPTFQPALIVISCLFITWQLRIPTKMRTNKIVSVILICCTFFCIIYCTESVYRLSFVISFVFGLMSIQHIFSII